MLIQLIEDDAHLAAVIAESFQAKGLGVEIFHQGAPALAAQGDGPYDVVVLDLGLPDQHGLQVLRTMRAKLKASQAGVVIKTMRKVGYKADAGG